MKKNILSIILLICSATLFSQTGPIIVTILNSQPFTGITNIQYEFSGTYLSYDILVEVSFDGDPYQAIPEYDLSGDLNNVAPGIRNIIWSGSASFPNFYNEQTRIRITATPEFACGDQITDNDGNVYNTVLIGTQCWMKENLKSITDADGNSISRICYDDSPFLCSIVGGLYTWYTLMNGAASSNNIPSGVRGICPNGWHIPSNAEWTVLTNNVSSQPGFICGGNPGYIGKAVAEQTLWQTSTATCAPGNDPGLNNAAGLSLLPAGYRTEGGLYNDFSYIGGYLSSTENGSNAWSRFIDYSSPGFYSFFGSKDGAASVRCVRD